MSEVNQMTGLCPYDENCNNSHRTLRVRHETYHKVMEVYYAKRCRNMTDAVNYLLEAYEKVNAPVVISSNKQG